MNAILPHLGWPRLAIVTVTLNDLAGLIATRASLGPVIDPGVAWVVVDGGSTDGTVDWLRAHADEITWWRSGPDGGIYPAMNIGLGVARTLADAVMFLNAGDALVAPTVLASIRQKLSETKADLLYGSAIERPSLGVNRMKLARSHHLVVLGMFTHHQSMVYRLSSLGRARFDARFTIGADYDFTLSVLRLGARVVRIDEAISVFRPGGVSERNAAIGRRDQMLIRRRHYQTATLWNFLIVILQWLACSVKRFWPRVYTTLRYSFVSKGVSVCRYRNAKNEEGHLSLFSGMEFSSSTNYVADRSPLCSPPRARK